MQLHGFCLFAARQGLPLVSRTGVEPVSEEPESPILSVRPPRHIKNNISKNLFIRLATSVLIVS